MNIYLNQFSECLPSKNIVPEPTGITVERVFLSFNILIRKFVSFAYNTIVLSTDLVANVLLIVAEL